MESGSLNPDVYVSPQKPWQKVKPLYIFLCLILLLIIAGFGYVFLQKFNQAPKPPLPVSVSPTPAIVRTENIPASARNDFQSREFDTFGKTKVKVSGTVEKIVNSNQYQLNLDSKKKITAIITEITVIGDAYFEINSQGIVLRSSYNIVDKEKLVNLKPGSKVSITYVKDQLVNNQVKVEEFILLD